MPIDPTEARAISASLDWRRHLRTCATCRGAQMGLGRECDHGLLLRGAMLEAIQAQHRAARPSQAL